jgi:hypothetical protein
VSSRRAPDLACIAVALAAAAAAPARAADASWRLRAELGPGFDSNALRVAGGERPGADAFAGAALRAGVRADSAGWALDAALSEGVRVFDRAPAADVLASRLDLGARRRVGGGAAPLELGLDATGRDLTERGGARDQAEGQGLASLGGRAGRAGWGAAAGWAVFAPRAAGLRAFRRDGPQASLSAAVHLAPEHAVAARYGFSAWNHRAWPGGRDDRAHALGAEWTWDGPVLASLGYAWSHCSSTVPAGAWRRHRVSARLAADLPLGLAAAARVAVQRASYPGGVALSEELLLGEGDETQNAVELQLARELREDLEVVVRVAGYRSELGTSAPLPFRRAFGQVAIGWRLGD